MKKRIVDTFRQMQIAWYTGSIKGYVRCKKLGYVDEETCFKKTTELVMKLMEVYTKRVMSGTVKPDPKIVKELQKLDALLHK